MEINKNTNKMIYTNRHDAAMKLIPLLEKYKKEDTIILAIPRGGVPIGFYLANKFHFPMALLLTKKIGHPLNKEVAIGAVSLEDKIIDKYPNISQEYIDFEVKKIRRLLKERYEKFRGNQKTVDLKDKTVIIVDDGIATGNTLLMAIQMIRNKEPSKIVVAAPVAPFDTPKKIKGKVDELVCPFIVDVFTGVGSYYYDFTEVKDEEVLRFMNAIDLKDKLINNL
jgi:predicted phosphoribosyltransferase